MRVTSAFFADWAGVYEQKLFVQGGVWDWFIVGPGDLPVEPVLSLVVILQIAADDRGSSTDMRIRILKPDSTEAPPIGVHVEVAPDWMPDHFIQVLPIRAPMDQVGRYVFLLETASEDDAYSVPLKVQEHSG